MMVGTGEPTRPPVSTAWIISLRDPTTSVRTAGEEGDDKAVEPRSPPRCSLSPDGQKAVAQALLASLVYSKALLEIPFDTSILGLYLLE